MRQVVTNSRLHVTCMGFRFLHWTLRRMAYLESITCIANFATIFHKLVHTILYWTGFMHNDGTIIHSVHQCIHRRWLHLLLPAYYNL